MLGAGGMGEVYLAQDLRLKRSVAIKVLPPDIAHNAQARQRFLQEARAASALSHPNIAHIYEVDKVGRVNFIAMEYVDGRTLRDYLKAEPRDLRELLDVVAQAAGALAAAHAAGVVHRDVKPENIMVRGDGYIKVLDFGLAKHSGELPQSVAPGDPTVGRVETSPGVVMGTVSYMSPEQARARPVDARADIWSLGVVFYEMLAGRPPFTGESAQDVIVAILEREPPPLSRYVSGLPEGLEWVVMKALAKDREQRYQTVKELLADVQRLKSRLEAEAELDRHNLERVPGGFGASGLSGVARTGQGPHTISSAEYIVNSIRQHKGVSLVAAALTLAALAGIVAFVSRRPPTPQAPQLILKRLTFDAGLQNNPSWSPDGRFIAYDSDRGGNFDLWVQPVSGGDPVRVTQSPAHDWQPDWSPDGTTLVFRSERDGGGLYLVSAFGGRERKVSSFGYHARWSPDGSKLLFLSPGTRLFDYPRVYVVSVDRPAAPFEVLNTVAGDAEPVKKGCVAWYPDGRRVSFLADGGAFWTVPLDGGAPVRSEVDAEVARRVKEAGLDFGAFRWSASRDTLYLEGVSSGVKNLWKVKVEPETMRWADGPVRLTTGFSFDTALALSPDGSKLAYSNQVESTRAWRFPFDARAGQLKGEGEPVTDPGGNAWFPDLSPDGRRLVYSAQQHGQGGQALWEKSLEDGQSRLLMQDDALRFLPRWSPDSRLLAYSLFRAPAAGAPDAEPARRGPIALLDPATREERLLTSAGASADYMYDWSPDGRWVLGSTNRATPDRWALALFPLSAAPSAESAMRVLASDPERDLWAPRFSPDGRWVCYIAQSSARPGVSVLYVMGAEGSAPARVTEEGAWADKPRWSPDGRIIYFISNRGSSFLNVWGVRFDPARGAAAGEPFRVTDFERPGRFISTQLAFAEMALGKSSLLLPVTEVSGSVWVLENVGPPAGRAGAED